MNCGDVAMVPNPLEAVQVAVRELKREKEGEGDRLKGRRGESGRQRGKNRHKSSTTFSLSKTKNRWSIQWHESHQSM